MGKRHEFDDAYESNATEFINANEDSYSYVTDPHRPNPYRRRTDDIDSTNIEDSFTEPYDSRQKSNNGSTEPMDLSQLSGRQPVDPLDAGTMPADAIEVNGVMIRPTVGWLVCVKGANKGMDFRLHGGFNTVGSGSGQDVVIQDKEVSRAMIQIVYGAKKREFKVVRCESSKNEAYLNDYDDMILEPKQLNSHDKLILGSTELIFVPLCTDEFSWEE